MLLAEEPRSHLDVHRADASSVVVHNVAPENVERFLEWQEGITAAVEQFPGYRSTELYPPEGDAHSQWVAVVHFDSRESLDNWLNSSVRNHWVNKLVNNIADYKIKRMNESFGPWFAQDFDANANDSPASWKMALTVLLGLYPTVMFLTIFVAPYTNQFGLAISVLIGNALCVSILQWLVMPALTRWLKPWLNAPQQRQRIGISLVGLLIVVTTLAGMSVIFRNIVD